MPRLDLWLLATCPHLITGPPVGVPGEPEYLQRRGKVAQDHAVKRHNRNSVRSCRATPARWLESCEDCLFGHWSNYHEVSHHAEQRDEEITADPVGGD